MWDQRYAAQEYAYGTEPNDFLRAQARRLPIGNTLCIGEGEGRNAVFLAESGHRVTALDWSAVGLDKTRRLAADRGVEVSLCHADLADYRFDPGRWDLIVSVFCHLPSTLRRRVHAQIAAALKPGGFFVLEAYHPDQLDHRTGGPPDADSLAALSTLLRELPGLRLVYAVETVRDVVEGRYHTGTGAVVQLAAVR